MSQTDRIIRRCNALLAAELGSVDGQHAALQWKWSADLTAPTPELDASGEPLYDYICSCGRNMRIHQAGCTLTTPVQRFIRMPIAPMLLNQWAICRWVMPPLEADWVRAFGNLDNYPANGTYVPLSVNDFHGGLRPGLVPDENRTWKIIHAVRNSQSIQQLQAEWREREALREQTLNFAPDGQLIYPDKGAKWWNTREAVRETLPSFGQRPGAKGHVSFPTAERVIHSATDSIN